MIKIDQNRKPLSILLKKSSFLPEGMIPRIGSGPFRFGFFLIQWKTVPDPLGQFWRQVLIDEELVDSKVEELGTNLCRNTSRNCWEGKRRGHQGETLCCHPSTSKRRWPPPLKAQALRSHSYGKGHQGFYWHKWRAQFVEAFRLFNLHQQTRQDWQHIFWNILELTTCSNYLFAK